MKYAVIFLLSFTSIFAVHVLSKLFAPPEVKIERMIRRMETGFNEGSVRRSLGSLADDWRHQDETVDRTMLEDGLRARFFTERDASDRSLLIRVEIPAESLDIKMVGEGATARFEARFYRMLANEWKLSWRIKVESTWEETEDGWRVMRSGHGELEGHRF